MAKRVGHFVHRNGYRWYVHEVVVDSSPTSERDWWDDSVLLQNREALDDASNLVLELRTNRLGHSRCRRNLRVTRLSQHPKLGWCGRGSWSKQLRLRYTSIRPRLSSSATHQSLRYRAAYRKTRPGECRRSTTARQAIQIRGTSLCRSSTGTTGRS